MNNISIKKVNTIEECLACNNMLEELIQFESKLDNQINENHKVSDFYERTLGKEDCIVFLAYYNNSPAGYVMAYKQKDNKALKSNVVNIMNLFIKQQYRNKKIGTLLISEVEKWAKSLYNNFVIELDCIINNEKALDFYKNLGYSPIRIKMRKEI